MSSRSSADVVNAATPTSVAFTNGGSTTPGASTSTPLLATVSAAYVPLSASEAAAAPARSSQSSSSASSLHTSSQPFLGRLRPRSGIVPQHMVSADAAARRTCKRRFRRFVWNTVSVRATKFRHVSTYWPSVLFEIVIVFFILSNCVVAVYDSEVENLPASVAALFNTFEVVSVIVFSVEYTLRLWACVEDKKYAKPFRGRIKWMLKPLSLIDLFALVAFYIDVVVVATSSHSNGLKSLRLLRAVSFLRMERQSKAFRRLRFVIAKVKEELMVSAFAASVCVLLAATIVYYFERDTADHKSFPSIPGSIWWAVTTMTTLSSGIVPTTISGRIITMIVSVVGVGLFSLPAGIMGAGFIEVMIEEKRAQEEAAAHRASMAQEALQNAMQRSHGRGGGGGGGQGGDSDDAARRAKVAAERSAAAAAGAGAGAGFAAAGSAATLCVTCPHCANSIPLQVSTGSARNALFGASPAGFLPLPPPPEAMHSAGGRKTPVMLRTP